MQTLTPTVFPCYAAADRGLAAAIAEFLERCGDSRVFLDEGELAAGQDLADKAREARMADVVLVLFTKESLPRPWPRSRWEGPLLTEPQDEGTRVAFARCDDCVPPRVLVPQFDLQGLPVKNLRGLKRWIRNPAAGVVERAPALEALGAALADRPGCETLATASEAAIFAEAFSADFEAVLRLECVERSLVALAGDLGAQLGMRLEGPLEENLARLREFCAARRFLVVLEGGTSPEVRRLVAAGRTSTIITETAEVSATADPLREAQRELATAEGRDWVALCAAARQGRRIASEQGRLAECYELMEQWHQAAKKHEDRAALDESAREMVWILERWDRVEEAARLEYERAVHYDDQMAFAW